MPCTKHRAYKTISKNLNSLIHICTLYSCNMGKSGLPDIYTRSTKDAGPRAEGVYISGKPRVPMLQLLCNT